MSGENLLLLAIGAVLLLLIMKKGCSKEDFYTLQQYRNSPLSDPNNPQNDSRDWIAMYNMMGTRGNCACNFPHADCRPFVGSGFRAMFPGDVQGIPASGMYPEGRYEEPGATYPIAKSVYVASGMHDYEHHYPNGCGYKGGHAGTQALA